MHVYLRRPHLAAGTQQALRCSTLSHIGTRQGCRSAPPPIHAPSPPPLTGRFVVAPEAMADFRAVWREREAAMADFPGYQVIVRWQLHAV